MARSRSAAAIAVAAVLVVAMAALVQPTSAACGPITNLTPCLSAASNGTPPTAQCCQAMVAFAKNGTPEGYECLCLAISNPQATQLGAKKEYAILLPKKCNLKFKAGYICNNEVVPGGQ